MTLVIPFCLSAACEQGERVVAGTTELRASTAFTLETLALALELAPGEEGVFAVSAEGLGDQEEVWLLAEYDGEMPLIRATHPDAGAVWMEEYANVTDADGEVHRYARLVLDTTVAGPYEVDYEMNEDGPVILYSCDEWVRSRLDDGSYDTLRSAAGRARPNARVCFDPWEFDGSSVSPVELQSEIRFAKAVEVWGTGVDASIVSANSQSRVFNMQAPYSSIENLTLENGFTPDSGGVIVMGGPYSQMRRARVRSGVAGSDGGGIYCGGNTLCRLEGVEVRDCAASPWEGGVGGGVFMDRGYIGGLELANNSAYEGGGAYLWEVNATNLHAYQNEALVNGGGVYAFAGSLVDTDIVDNTAENGGGVFASEVTLAGVHIRDNKATEGPLDGPFLSPTSNGGGVYISQSEPAWIGDSAARASMIENNEADDDGGGVYCPTSDLRLDGETQIIDNRAGLDGGGVYMFGELSLSAQTSVENNAAGRDGGGIAQYSPLATVDIDPGPSGQVQHNRAAETEPTGRGGGMYTRGATNATSGFHVLDNFPDDIFSP